MSSMLVCKNCGNGVVSPKTRKVTQQPCPCGGTLRPPSNEPPEPEFDMEGYPTANTLELITKWNHNDYRGLLIYIRKAWQYPERCKVWGRKLKLSTGGWSGNESIIEALKQNVIFWSTCWRLSQYGGYYKFEVPKQIWRIKNKAETPK